MCRNFTDSLTESFLPRVSLVTEIQVAKLSDVQITEAVSLTDFQAKLLSHTFCLFTVICMNEHDPVAVNTIVSLRY